MRFLIMAAAMMVVTCATGASATEKSTATKCFPLAEVPIAALSGLKSKASVDEFEIRMEESSIDSIFNKRKGSSCAFESDHVSKIRRFGNTDIVLIESGSASRRIFTPFSTRPHHAIDFA